MKLVSTLLAATAAGVAATDRKLASSCAPQADYKGVAYGACAPDGSARTDILTACGADTGPQDDDFIGNMRDLFVCPNGALVSQEIGAGRDFGFEQCVSDGLKAAYCPDSAPSPAPSPKPSAQSPAPSAGSNPPIASSGAPSSVVVTGAPNRPSAQPVAFTPVPTLASSSYAPYSLAPFSPAPSSFRPSSSAPSLGSLIPTILDAFSFAPSADGTDAGMPTGWPTYLGINGTNKTSTNGTAVHMYEFLTDGNHTVWESPNGTQCMDPSQWACGNASAVALPRAANFSDVCDSDIVSPLPLNVSVARNASYAANHSWYAMNCSWMSAELSYAPTGAPTGSVPGAHTQSKSGKLSEGETAGVSIGSIVGGLAIMYAVARGVKSYTLSNGELSTWDAFTQKALWPAAPAPITEIEVSALDRSGPEAGGAPAEGGGSGETLLHVVPTEEATVL